MGLVFKKGPPGLEKSLLILQKALSWDADGFSLAAMCTIVV